MPNPKITKLYNALLNNGYTEDNLGDIESFGEDMADPQYRKEFYDYVKGNGDDLGDYEEYERWFSSPTIANIPPSPSSMVQDVAERYERQTGEQWPVQQLQAPATQPATPAPQQNVQQPIQQPAQQQTQAQTPTQAPAQAQTPQQGWTPTPGEMAALGNVGGSVARVQQAMDDNIAANEVRLANGIRVPGRDNLDVVERPQLGDNPNVVRGQNAVDIESGDVKPTFTTEAGDTHTSRGVANMEQDAIDQEKEYKADPLGYELREAYRERDYINNRITERNDQIEKDYAGLGGGGLTMGMDNMGNLNPDGVLQAAKNNDVEYQRWSVAARQNRERIRALEALRDKDGMGVFGTIGRALDNTLLTRENWDFGNSDWMRMATLIGSGNSSTEGEARADESLMRESMLAESAAAREDKEMDNLYRWSKIGGQSLVFASQFFATGSGYNGLTRLGTKYGAKAAMRMGMANIKKDFVRKTGMNLVKHTGTLAGDVAGAGAMALTVQAPMVAADVAKRKRGSVDIDDNGNLVYTGGESLGTALRKGVLNMTVENYTEKFGVHLPGLSRLATKGAERVGLTSLSNWMARASASGVYKTTREWLRRAGVNGYTGEVIEEEINIPLNALFVGDQEIGELIDPRTQADILGGMAVSMGIMGTGSVALYGGGSAAAYYDIRKRLKGADKTAGSALGENWAALRDEIESTVNEDMPDLMVRIRNDRDMNRHQKTAVGDFIQRTLQMRGFNIGLLGRAEGGETDINAEMADLSFIQGREAPASEREGIKRRFEEAYINLFNTLGEESLPQMSYEAWLDAARGYERVAGEQNKAAAIREWLDARSVWQGVSSAEQEEAESITHKTDGMVHPITVFDEKGLGEGYLISGNIVANADGSIAAESEDNSMGLVYVDRNGESHIIAPNMVQSVFPAMEVDAYLNNARIMAANAPAAPPAAPDNGDTPSATPPVTPPATPLAAPPTEGQTETQPGVYNVGDEVGVVVDGVAYTGTVSEVDADGNVHLFYDDGSGIQRPLDTTAAQLDEWAAAAQQQQTEGDTAINEEQPTDTPTEQQDDLMPMIGEGEEANPDYSKVTPARAVRYIDTESGLSEKEADEYVEANIVEARKALAEAQSNTPKMGADLAKYRKAKAEYDANVAAAQANADYWEAVKEERRKAKAALQPVVETPADNETDIVPDETSGDLPMEDVNAEDFARRNITLDENGQPMFEALSKEATLTALFGVYRDNIRVRDYVNGRVESARKAAAELRRKKPRGNNAERLSSWNGQMAAAQSVLDYWNSVKADYERITHTTAAETKAVRDEVSGEAAKAYAQSTTDNNMPANGVAFASRFIVDAKITPESFRQETGFGNADMRKFVGMIAGSDKVLTEEAVGVTDKIPDIEGGKATDIYLPQTRSLRSVMKYVKNTLDAYDKMTPAERAQNSHIPLTMYGIAKAAAVDPRLVVADAADEESSKTNETVRQTLRTLEETKDYLGTVAIFADNYQNKRTGFNLYEDIKKKLVARGVPESQIAIMKSGMSVEDKVRLFSDVNQGRVRVIMGSTFTLGTGVNIQERLHTLIHVDAPNRPMDYTQRNGRILRQGNIHKEMGKPVRVLRFGVEDSLDVTAYQRLKTKGEIADSIMHGKRLMADSMRNRVLEEDEDVFGDTVAQLSGSEYAMLKNQAERDVRKYEARRKQWEADQTYIHNTVPRLRGVIKANGEMAAECRRLAGEVAKAFPGGATGEITAGGQTFASVAEMGDLISESNKAANATMKAMREDTSAQSQRRTLKVSLGGYTFDIVSTFSKEVGGTGTSLFSEVRRKMTYSCPELGLSDVPVKQGLLRNALEDITGNVITGRDFTERAQVAEAAVERDGKELEQMLAREGQPFEDEERLAVSRQRLVDYEQKMKEELAAKEAKYADMDADIEAASNVGYAEEEDSDGEAEGETRFRDPSLSDDETDTETETGASAPSSPSIPLRLEDVMAIEDTVERLEGEFGVPVRIARDLSEVKNDRVRAAITRGKDVRGWFETSSGGVVIYLPNARGADDVAVTYAHEVIGHKGMRGLLGEERYGEMCDGIMELMTEEQREKNRRKMRQYDGYRDKTDAELDRIGGDERIADIAETMVGVDGRITNPSLWDRVKGVIRDFLRNHSVLDLDFTDDDIRYMLWKSAERLRAQRGRTPLETVRDIATERELRDEAAASRGDERFRDGSRSGRGKRKSALDTGPVKRKEGRNPLNTTVVSSADGAKVVRNLESLISVDGDDVLFRIGDDYEGSTEEERGIIARAKADGTWLKAPNGRASNLDGQQWTHVRTKAFKGWFGDWEKAARIEKLRGSEPVVIKGDEYKGKYELNRDSAKEWIKKNLRGEYTIDDTGESITVSKVGANKVTSHSMGNEAHLKSIVVIPRIIKSSVFVEERSNEKDNDKYDSYRYYVCGLKIGGEDYTVKMTVGVKQGKKYYDHALTQVEKGKLLDLIGQAVSGEGFTTTEGAPMPSSALSEYKDKKLLSILQTNSSKVVDGNGEPRVVYHGTPLSRGQITPGRGWHGDEYVRQEMPFTEFRGGDYSGLVFASVDYDKARGIAERRSMSIPDDENGNERWTEEGYVYDLFLNVRKPFDPRNVEELRGVLAGMGGEIPTLSFYGGRGDAVSVGEAVEMASAAGNTWIVTETPEFVAKIKELGYDGLRGFDEGVEYFAATSPNQIKSATDNNGDYSPENDDIRFRIGNARREKMREAARGVAGDTRFRAGDSNSRISATKDRIEDLFRKAVSGDFRGKPVSIGRLTEAGREYLEALSGLSFKENVDFVLNPSDLSHINNRHFGENEKETQRNVPLGIDDIRSILDVVMLPERLYYAQEKDGDKRKMFFFLKSSGSGTYNLLEIYSDRKGNLTAKSFYKTRRGITRRVMELENSLLLTSETYSGASPLPANVPQMFEPIEVSVVNNNKNTRFKDNSSPKASGGETLFRVASSRPGAGDAGIEAVNERFNSELERFTLSDADSFVFDLGRPSAVLVSGGVADRPIRLHGSKVAKKMRKHGFSASDLRDLPLSLSRPVAVFDNTGRVGNRSVLTELRMHDGNVLVSIDLGRGSEADFDIVSSVFGKRGESVVSWLNKGMARYIDKEKALRYLHLSAPIAEASDSQGLVSAAKIVEDFENPPLPVVNNNERARFKAESAPDPSGGETLFRIREGAPPRQTISVYKLFNVDSEGRPHALFIDAGNTLSPGVWYDADSPSLGDLAGLDVNKSYLVDGEGNVVESVPTEVVRENGKARFKGLPSKTQVNAATENGQRWMAVTLDASGGRQYHTIGINGSGMVSPFALRPGWHATNVPSARHIGAGKNGGESMWRRPDQRWFEVELAADNDYNEEVRERYLREHPGYDRERAYSDLKGDMPERIPADGYYNFKTNSNANPNQEWYIGGSMKIVRPITEKRAHEIARQAGVSEDLPYKDGVKAFDEGDMGDTLFRDPSEAVAGLETDWRREYDKSVGSGGGRFVEAAQDGMRSLSRLQEAVAGETGKKIKESEDVWSRQNRLSSANRFRQDFYEENFYKPLINAVKTLVGLGARYERKRVVDGEERYVLDEEYGVLQYIITKHGIERNEYFRKLARDKADEDNEKMREKAKEAMRAKMRREAETKGEPYSEAEADAAFARWEHDSALRAARRAAAAEAKAKGEPFDRKAFDKGFTGTRRYAVASEESQRRDYSGLSSIYTEGDFNALAPEYAKHFEEKFGDAVTELWKRINAATKESLRQTFDGGLISKAQYDKARTMFKYYVPLRGWMNDNADKAYDYRESHGGSLGGSLVKKMRGRTSLAENPLAVIGTMAQQDIFMAGKNGVKQALYNLAAGRNTKLLTVSRQWYVNNGTEDEPLWERAYPELTDDMGGDDVAAALESFNERMKALSDEGKATQKKEGLRLKYRTTGEQARQHRVEVSVGGKEYVVYVNGSPRAAQALNGELRSSEAERGFLRRTNRWLAGVYTSLNPEFTLTNYERDALFAASIILATEDASYQKNWAKNMVLHNPFTGGVRLLLLMNKGRKGKLDRANRLEAYMAEFLENGGETGYVNNLTVEDYKKAIQRELNGVNHVMTPVKAIRAYMRAVEFFNRMFENSTRFATYVTSREQGRSVSRSIGDAKEVSLNFNTRGADGLPSDNGVHYFFRNLRRMFIFTNPSIQGLAKAGRAFKSHPARSTLTMAGIPALLGFAIPALAPLLTAALAGAIGDDDDDDAETRTDSYKDLSKWVRRTNICIPVGNDNFIAIPLSYELRVAYGLGEMMWEAEQGMIGADEIALETTRQLSDLLPVSLLSDNVVSSLTPSLFSPLVDVALNKDFTGKPLWRENVGNRYRPEYTKAYKGTAQWLVKSSELLNGLISADGMEPNDYNPGVLNHQPLTNPSAWEHVLDGYLGGLYTFPAKVAKTVSMAVSDDEWQWRNTMMLSRNVRESRYGDEESRATGERYRTYVGEYWVSRSKFGGYRGEAKLGSVEFLGRMREFVDTPQGRRYGIVSAYKPVIDKLEKAMDAYDEGTRDGGTYTAANRERWARERERLVKEMVDKCDNIGE